MTKNDYLKAILYGKPTHPPETPRWLAAWAFLVVAVLALCAFAMLYQSRIISDQEAYIQRLEQVNETNALTRIQDELANPKD